MNIQLKNIPFNRHEKCNDLILTYLFTYNLINIVFFRKHQQILIITKIQNYTFTIKFAHQLNFLHFVF